MSTQISTKRDILIEEVCSHCPATSWGKKSVCRVHDLHVGKVETCPEWEKYCDNNRELEESDQSSAGFTDLEPAFEILQRTEEDIKDYRYMMVEIKRIQNYMNEIGSGTVSLYGAEFGQPRGKGIVSNRTHAEVAQRERKWKRLANLQASVDRIHRAADSITDKKERVVIEALLDGERNVVIAKQIGVSRQKYYNIKRTVIMKMALFMYGDEITEG
ncbi:hypothetical protein [Brevibacillus choshinensis]|uniref:hypothetical protein n=1 Tax=Brevibacillus choshinensis TaxID=54911 RepID=UPI001EEE4CE6|nr:hypothetical protein [Brevibacillus choshinensis]